MYFESAEIQSLTPAQKHDIERLILMKRYNHRNGAVGMEREEERLLSIKINESLGR